MKYFILNDLSLYKGQPICADVLERDRFSIENGINIDFWHEAAPEEIEKYGVWNFSGKKYELIPCDTVEFAGVTLYRIRSLAAFICGNGRPVKIGDFGGYIESEKNLSNCGEAWVSDGAMVFGSATVFGNALVQDTAIVCENARVCGDAHASGGSIIRGNSTVCGFSRISERATVSGNAKIYGSAWLAGIDVASDGAEIFDSDLIPGLFSDDESKAEMNENLMEAAQ